MSGAIEFTAYARAGTGELWIVVPCSIAIEVFGEPHFTGHVSKAVSRTGNEACPAAFPNAAEDIVQLLKRAA